MARVLLLRLGLAALATAAVTTVALWQAVPSSTAAVAVCLTIGFALRACADTPLAALRLHGRQGTEARCRVASAVVEYGYAFGALSAGAPAAVVCLFKPIGALALLGSAWWTLKRDDATPPPTPYVPLVRPLIMGAAVLGAADLLGVAYNKTNVFFIQSAGGAGALAFYGATWTVVDAISVLGSEQLIACVVFPALALAWREDRAHGLALVRRQAVYLFLLGCLAAFALRQEAPLILGLLYPSSYAPAVALQKVLALTVLLSLEGNLFASLLIVAGAARLLLVLAASTALASVALNAWLVPVFGLPGACWAIVLTKLAMTVAAGAVCQHRFHLVPAGGWPVVLAFVALAVASWAALERFLPPHVGVAFAVSAGLALWVRDRRRRLVPST